LLRDRLIYLLISQLSDENALAFCQLLDAYIRIGECTSQFENFHNGLGNVPPGEVVYWPDIQAIAVIYTEIMAFQRHAYHFFRRIGWCDMILRSMQLLTFE
jgi:hypothetical protein